MEKLTGQNIPFVKGDVRNRKDLKSVFSEYEVNAVLHFAGLKSVGESVDHPLSYFDNNFNGTLNLCEVMTDFDCKVLAFSSSATVGWLPRSHCSLPGLHAASGHTGRPLVRLVCALLWSVERIRR